MDFETSNQGTQNQSLNRFQRTPLIWSGVAILCLISFAIIFFSIGIINSSTSSKFPNDSIQGFKSTVYRPTKLPGNYKIDKNSVSLAENNTVLIFEARDGAGSTLSFTEQASPKDFDFDDFYKNQLNGAKTLSNVRHPSVWGKTLNGHLTLSVVTDDAWILMTTSAPLSENDMHLIAQNIKNN